MQRITSDGKEYGELRVDQPKRLKEMKPENTRQQKVVADLSIQSITQSNSEGIPLGKETARGNF